MNTTTETPAPLSVILCDDELSIVHELENAIEWNKLGIRITGTAQSGTDALELLIAQNPDIAVMDIRMPDISGLDVIRRAKNANCTTNFLILSGYDDFSYAKDAIHLGARAYLLKPLNIQELYDSLYQICAEHGADSRGNVRRAYRRQLDQNFFHNLIDGKILEQGVVTTVLQDSATMLTDTDCYVCVLAYPEDIKAAEEALPVLENAFAQEHALFFPYNASSIVGIFNSTDEISFQRAERILSILKDAGLPLPVIGVGDTVPGLMNVSYSYSRALTAITYQLYNAQSHIFTYSEICTVPPSFQLDNFDYLPLVQYIVKKDQEGIRQFCDQFMEHLLYVKMPPPNYLFSTCYALIHMIEQEIANYTHGEIHELSTPGELYQFHSVAEIRDRLIHTFSYLSEFIDAVYGYAKTPVPSAHPSQKEDEIIVTARDYIHNNITNHLRIEDIAREVHLSTSYFAIYFKNKTGINLRDFILTEKMEYARRALLNPDASITEIAYEVGYQDYRSFSRAFKNIHGITPSDFQSRHRSV